MARKAKREAAQPETVDTTVAGIATLDTLPGETHGLVVTAPVEEVVDPVAAEPEFVEPEQPDEIDQVEEAGIEPVVSGTISNDPSDSVAAALLALGRIYNEAGVVGVALSKHLRGTAGEPELHSFLHGMQVRLGEFRHAVEQLDAGMSDQLRAAIHDAMAA